MLLSLKANHKAIRTYYQTLEDYGQLGVVHESAVRSAFQELLTVCGRQVSWMLVPEYTVKRAKRSPIRVDGALLDQYNLVRGFWEAKDSQDDLKKEVQKKFAVGYPKDNILFQQPERVILYQDGRLVCDEEIRQPQILVDVVRLFFEYTPPQFEQWEEAASEFGERVKEHAEALLSLIREQEKINKQFIEAFGAFVGLCRKSINPNLSEAAVEEMLIQHLLTERIFRSVFNNPDFSRKNVIAVEIEKVIDALTSKHFSRSHFLSKLDRFYGAIETTAATIEDFGQKQSFLNTIYEKFFQGFSVKVADTHGIVYTPQPIVNFMVKSVEAILQREFGKSLVDKGVHILDPFVGTGNFIMRVMQEIVEIQKSALPSKYENELHCNEVMLLPYYIASINIEHEYYEQIGNYKSFEGICLVDTFDVVKENEQQLGLFSKKNAERLEKQKKSNVFVIIGNPPYNATQQNEMDLKKNRHHLVVDQWIKETYLKNSKSIGRTTRKLLFDPYIKAFCWSQKRLEDEGVICFVTNNSFIDDLPFDGMRKILFNSFDKIYVLDLKGNVRKDSMRDGIPIGEKHTVFGLSAMVGVCITFLVKKNQKNVKSQNKIFYSSIDWRATRLEKFKMIDQVDSLYQLKWEEINPDINSTWLTQSLQSDFNDLISLGNKLSKSLKPEQHSDCVTIFLKYALGVSTNRDIWLFNFNETQLLENVNKFIITYNSDLDRWNRSGEATDVYSLISTDETKIKYSSLLLDKFQRKDKFGKPIYIISDPSYIRRVIYRPFSSQFLYFDKHLIDAPTLQPYFFPTISTEEENKLIAVTVHSQSPFIVQMTSCIPCMDLGGRPTQCFPFYIYDKNGANRQENITDWALTQFQNQYQDPKITKWDIFYYTYAVLHHPQYRQRYGANLKRELPRIPYAPEFWPFAEAGQRLAEVHVDYENQPEYPLKHIENKDLFIDWRVEKMRLSKDKTQIKYNDFLTLTGIPPEAFNYRLGNRSALDWVIDQYQIKTDKRSGITNDPNRLDDEEYIVRLIKQVITISLETVQIVNNLPDLGLPKD